MIAVVQRVARASVEAELPGAAPHRGAIGRGLCALLCVERGDGDAEAAWMARKLAGLRLFPDDQGRMNLDLAAIGGEIMIVSQFTLAGDCSRGNRPSFVGAAAPEDAEALFDRCCGLVEASIGRPVVRGRFRCAMRVELVNDGPVTVIVRT